MRRMRACILPVGLLVILQSAACGGDGGDDAADDSSTNTVKIVTYNIEHGAHVPDAMSAIAALLKEHRPDVVCLQEAAWRLSPPPRATGQPVMIAEALGGYRWAGANRRPSASGQCLGPVVVTRGNILQREELRVGKKPPYGILIVVAIDRLKLVVVSARFQSLGGATFRGALATEGDRVAQAKHLLDRLKSESLPIIIGADLNALPFFPAATLLSTSFRDAAVDLNNHAFTRMTRGLPARIDYVFFSPHFSAEKYEVWPVDFSDHRPVAVTLKLQLGE